MKIKLVIALLLIGLPCMAQEYGIICINGASLYQKPDYESPLETQELMGQVVEILATEGYWMKVSTPQPYTAWVNAKAVVPVNGQQLADYKAAPKYVVKALHSNIVTAPRANSETICMTGFHDLLRVDRSKNSTASYCPVILPDGRQGWIRRSDIMRQKKSEEIILKMTAEQKRERVISTARSMLGAAYLWGGMTPFGVDCSGLVRLSFMSAGKFLPRNASQQYSVGEDIALGHDANGTPSIEGAALLPADLLFFGHQRKDGSWAITHVGIYLGQGRMIHASHLVRINSLRKGDDDLYENASRLCKACRIIR